MRKVAFFGLFMLWLVGLPIFAQSTVIQLRERVDGTFGMGGGTATYQFTADADTRIVLNVVNDDYTGAPVLWDLVGPGSVPVVTDEAFLNTNQPINLPSTGTYTLTLDWPAAVTGNYGFIVWDVPTPDVSSTSIGAVMRGEIETPGVVDVYNFSAIGGQQVYFNVLDEDFSGVPTLWSLVGPGGVIVTIGDEPFLTDNTNPINLPNNGTYTLTVDPRGGITGPYSIRLIDSNAPYATNDVYGVRATGTITINAASGVLANDGDRQNDALTAQLVSDVTHGTLTLNADGSFTYTPGATFTTEDDFTYRASDGVNLSNMATVRLTVGDPPRIYPAHTEGITRTATWSRFQFEAKPGADWYGIWIGSDDYTATSLYQWYDAAIICTGDTCTLPVDLWLPNGDYIWWMTYYGPTLEDFNNYWNETLFTLNVPVAPAPTSIGIGNPGASNPEFVWDAAADVLWYHVVLTPSDYSWVYDMGWHRFDDLTCTDGICTYTEANLAGGLLPAGDYLLYIGGWGPGGLTTGGISNSGYAEGAFTYTP